MIKITAHNRWKCTECGWLGTEILFAPNPFDNRLTTTGCPNCLEVNSIIAACDVEGCEKEGSCGWPSDAGYRWTCYEHADGLKGN
jgi:hypothetical protein